MAGTVIGSSITIDGEVNGSEPLVVQGVVKGKVTLESSLHVEPGGQVEAEVRSTNVVIGGTVDGTVLADEKLEVKEGGKVLGTVRAPRILIADGALFKGQIEMDV